MKYIDFYEQFKDLPFINITDVKTVFPDFDHRRMYEWQKAGYVKKIRRDFYIFSNKKQNEEELCFIGNKLREPSYISLEYALNYYSLIPEAVFLFTYITTKKTALFETKIGNFSYRTVKKSLFFGYILKGNEKSKYKIAGPEKALLDFLYLRTDLKNDNDIKELRINADIYKNIIDTDKLNKYLEIFGSPLLTNKVRLLEQYIQKND